MAARIVPDAGISWHAFRDRFRELGGDGIYAAWQLTYLEPAFRNQYEPGLCPVAESLQPFLLQFKTNYWEFDQGREAGGNPAENDRFTPLGRWITMFEISHYDPRKHAQPVTPPAGEPFDRVPITHRSLLYWCEHCVECAAPACYQTCDLYQPRRDGHCRRFQYGIFQSAAGAEIAFKKWAKLETTGNIRMFPCGDAARAERCDRARRPTAGLEPACTGAVHALASGREARRDSAVRVPDRSLQSGVGRQLQLIMRAIPLPAHRRLLPA